MITIEITNINQVYNDIQRKVDAYSRKYDKAAAEISDMAVNQIQDNIFEGKNFRGGKLKANAISTVRKKGFNWPLIHTGDMAKGISKKAIPDGYEVYMGDKPKIAAMLQSGFLVRNRTGYRQVPARPFFGINTAFRKKAREILKVIFNR